MATRRGPSLLNANASLDDGPFFDKVKNQLTLTNAAVGEELVLVLSDGGADEGFTGKFEVPQEYVGSPELVIKGILDGAPAAANTLGFGVTGKNTTDKDSVDAAFSTEDVVSETIGSNGTGHGDEQHYEKVLPLSNFVVAAGKTARFYVFLDSSGTSYGGNFLLEDIFFQYSDV